MNVLVVDDSAVVRQSMAAVLSRDPLLCVEVASDPVIAQMKMQRSRPDVIVLDLEMPRMHGLDFLRKIMAEDPIPVVICSGYTGRGTTLALRALAEGAVDIVAKPEIGVRGFIEESAVMLIETVRAAARARVSPLGVIVRAASQRPSAVPPPIAPAGHEPIRSKTPFPAPIRVNSKVVVIGASTGGTEALRGLLGSMPPDCPAFVIAQHMPPVFTAAFAASIDRESRIEVKEAAHGDRIASGRALIAPGGKHMSIVSAGAHFCVALSDGPLVSGHRPSVDVLFQSAARTLGRSAIGIILTGMGSDGALGLLEMKRAGAATVAQDEKTCVVFGMPKEAINMGAVDEIVPLPQIPAVLTRLLRQP